MTELSMQQKREWAKTLYLKENLTQQEIAERVGVSRVTVNNWIGKNGWEMLKTSITITREEQLKNLYRQLTELNNAIMAKPEGGTFPERRGGGHHIQTVQRHQEDGDRSRALGHHIRILKPAQMAACVRPHAGEGGDAPA